ncbi:MAG TPA: asparagine synthase (glutamine-hydrolyzing) [Bryobacteraceae bacterium]|nr:asparagine synthase (glutamine-hydrolyzing) [Bryobacteraceae bacterium]
MCGIAGFVTDHQEKQADPELTRAMCGRMAHRGPDGYGHFEEGPVALGHLRLSIIDLEGGWQPIGNEDGRLQVVFNGEIYNYRELRSELQAKGHQFTTNSDTEVLVHLYEEVGERMAERLNGMFAFAIWDRRAGELFLARDRFGKKPLYYSTSTPGYRILFASELKAFAAVPGVDSTFRPESVADFLAFSYVPDPDSIYRSIQKLPPATTLTRTAGGARLRRYWTLEFGESGSEVQNVARDLGELASDAVTKRMISDVPLGAFLSGGVDSSGVVAYMSQAAAGRVKTFSIGFTAKEFDETAYARQIVSRYGTDHYERTVTPDISEMLGVLVHHFDEPFGDSSAVPTLYLSRMTRERVTVALSGDGADEIFGGYRRYRFGVAEERVRQRYLGSFGRRLAASVGRVYPKFDYLPRPLRAKATLQNLGLELGDAYFSSMTTFRDQGLRNILAPELLAALGGYDPREAYRERFRRVAHLGPLEQMQAVDMETWLPGDILVKADRATMAYSLEGRSPWLDYRIAEYAARLPSSWKIKGLQGKHGFKKLLEPLVPNEILYRPKMGFSVPLAHWFRTSLTGVYRQTVLGGEADGLVSRVEAGRLLDQHLSGLHDHSRKLWNVLMLACWWRRHVRGLVVEMVPAADH